MVGIGIGLLPCDAGYSLSHSGSLISQSHGTIFHALHSISMWSVVGILQRNSTHEPVQISLSQLYIVIRILTHWGRVTHICVGKLTIIGSDNGLTPERLQAIIWTNAGILLTGPLGTNFSEILIDIQTFSLKKIRLKMSSAKCCSFRLGLNVLMSLHCAIMCIPEASHASISGWPKADPRLMATCLTHCQTLTHWGRDKMAAIFQTTFSNGFSLMKMYEFRLKFHWSLFPRVQLAIYQHWFR